MITLSVGFSTHQREVIQMETAANLFQGVFSGNSLGILKASGVLTALGGLIFLIVKFDLIKWIVIEDGQRGLRVRWGRAKKDKKTGEYKILKPGGKRYLYFKVIHAVAVVNIRVSASSLGQLTVTFKGHKILMTMKTLWEIEDTPQSIRDSVFSVNDPDRFDTTNKTLEELVVGFSKQAVVAALRTTQADEDGLPILDLDMVKEHIDKDLREVYGVKWVGFIDEEISFSEAQLHKDGLMAVAEAIRFNGQLQANYPTIHSA